MPVDQLPDYLRQHWPAIRDQLLTGTYEPQPVRRVEIPKPDGGGVRKLRIPSVLGVDLEGVSPGVKAKRVERLPVVLSIRKPSFDNVSGAA